MATGTSISEPPTSYKKNIVKITVFREEATSVLVSYRSSILVEFGEVGFCGGRKTEEPRAKPS